MGGCNFFDRHNGQVECWTTSNGAQGTNDAQGLKLGLNLACISGKQLACCPFSPQSLNLGFCAKFFLLTTRTLQHWIRHLVIFLPSTPMSNSGCRKKSHRAWDFNYLGSTLWGLGDLPLFKASGSTISVETNVTGKRIDACVLQHAESKKYLTHLHAVGATVTAGGDPGHTEQMSLRLPLQAHQ